MTFRGFLGLVDGQFKYAEGPLTTRPTALVHFSLPSPFLSPFLSPDHLLQTVIEAADHNCPGTGLIG